MVGQNSGSIVITSSQVGLEGTPGHRNFEISAAASALILGGAGLSAYSASKWAVRGLALTAALELTPLGIRVNSICPGPIETPLTDVFSKERRSKMAEGALMKRLGRPEEVANAILYLSSGAAS
jgi:NAD(P)-dependent dehydrogenase (short-subunit alcohol dehydrogenase family)